MRLPSITAACCPVTASPPSILHAGTGHRHHLPLSHPGLVPQSEPGQPRAKRGAPASAPTAVQMIEATHLGVALKPSLSSPKASPSAADSTSCHLRGLSPFSPLPPLPRPHPHCLSPAMWQHLPNWSPHVQPLCPLTSQRDLTMPG